MSYSSEKAIKTETERDERIFTTQTSSKVKFIYEAHLKTTDVR